MKTASKRKLLNPGIPMGGKESVAGGQTVITATQTHVWFRRFMIECPSGLQTLHEFKALLGLQGLNQRANQYADQLFNIFDKNKDGFIDFLEFIAAVNLVIQRKMDQKLKWYFKLYDADGNGSIDRKELLNIFMAIQAINGQNTLNAQEFTNLVFEKIDVNSDDEDPEIERSWNLPLVVIGMHGPWSSEEGSVVILGRGGSEHYACLINVRGELTLEEFISGLEKDPNLLEMITKSFDLSHVLKVIQSGRKQDTLS